MIDPGASIVPGVDRLRVHWDFADLEGTETRLREALGAEVTAEGRAEVLTQLARVDGLRGAFSAGERLLDEAELLGERSPVVTVRVALERGRLRRSGGDAPAALPCFETAYAAGCAAELWSLAADAAHMAALAAPPGEGFVTWTGRGIELAQARPEASYWAGPLLNNLGWQLLGDGDAAGALDAFEQALAARELAGDPEAVAIARYAVGRALRALGRSDEAIVQLEAAIAWSQEAERPDGWFHEELAEELAAVGRTAEAAHHAGVALPLLEADDPSLADDRERRERLAALAAAS